MDKTYEYSNSNIVVSYIHSDILGLL